jgi:hypothetical protein
VDLINQLQQESHRVEAMGDQEATLQGNRCCKRTVDTGIKQSTVDGCINALAPWFQGAKAINETNAPIAVETMKSCHQGQPASSEIHAQVTSSAMENRYQETSTHWSHGLRRG